MQGESLAHWHKDQKVGPVVAQMHDQPLLQMMLHLNPIMVLEIL